MKKLIFMLAVCVLFVFGGVEASSIPREKDYLTVSSFPNMHQIKWTHLSRNQINWNYDLNGDRRKEKIVISASKGGACPLKITCGSKFIQINDQERTLYGAALLDINKKDRYEEIALYCAYESDDDDVLLCRYNGNSISLMDDIPLVTDAIKGMPQGLYINNDNIVSSVTRETNFQTHGRRVFYIYNEVKNSFFEIRQNFDPLQGNYVTCKKQLSIVDGDLTINIPKGTRLKVIGCYIYPYYSEVLLGLPSGKKVWYQIGDDNEGFDNFDGLILYD